jgi:pimeloyl-ACP methyl ester carboxylesterase
MSGFEERRWTSRDGLSLFARDYAGVGGDARLPVICLHGLTRNSKDFEDVAPLLVASGRRVLVPDVRGRGLSDHDPNPLNYAPKIYACDVLELMDRLGIGRAIFLGTSMGGLVIMALAGMRSRAVAAAILNDVGPEISPVGVERIKSYVGKPVEIGNWDDAIAYVRRINSGSFPKLGDDAWKRLASRTFRDVAGKPQFDYDPKIFLSLNRRRPGAAILAKLLFRRLARRRPTLLLRGALSDLISAEIADRMERAAPKLTRVDIPDVGHAPLLDEPVSLSAIDHFLRTVP